MMNVFFLNKNHKVTTDQRSAEASMHQVAKNDPAVLVGTKCKR